MRKWLSVLCLFFCVPVTAQHLVGNGGDGILVNDRLYLRDLYEPDIHGQEYLGDEIHSDLKVLVETEFPPALKKIMTEEQVLLLLRKLTDLEKYYPCLGSMLVGAINSYSWFFENTPLGLLPDTEPVRIFPDESRIQIANRYYRSIRIHKASWDALSDTDKVALIFHEIFYSLQIPRANLRGEMAQSAAATRLLTAMVFQHASFRDSRLREMIGNQMVSHYAPLVCEAGSMIFTLQGKRGADLSQVVLPNKNDRQGAAAKGEPVSRSTSTNDVVHNICAAMTKNPQLILQMNLTKDRVARTYFERFRDSVGEHQYLRLREAYKIKTCREITSVDFRRERKSCVAFIQEELEVWRTSQFPDQVRFPYCD